MGVFSEGPMGGGPGGVPCINDGYAWSCAFTAICTYIASKTTCTNFSDASTWARLGQYIANPVLQVAYRERVFIKFDTSTIPANAIITSAKLRLKGQLDGSVQDFNIILRKWTGDTPIDCGDYNQYDGVNYGSFNTAGFGVGVYNDIIITNFALIAKAGFTKICCLSDRDLGDNQPAWGANEYVSVYMNEFGVGFQPILEVIYTLPVVGRPLISKEFVNPLLVNLPGVRCRNIEKRGFSVCADIPRSMRGSLARLLRSK